MTGPHSPAWQESVRLLFDLHRHFLDGTEESPEADAIRDAMEAGWMAMTEAERENVGAISAALFPGRRDARAAPTGT